MHQKSACLDSLRKILWMAFREAYQYIVFYLDFNESIKDVGVNAFQKCSIFAKISE